jgi:hypothetical protein
MPPPPPGALGLGYGASIVGLWPLVLTKGARAMTVVFIVLGALVYVGLQVFNVGFGNVFQKAIARVQVQNAYAQLSSDTVTFRSDSQACRTASDPLQCLDAAAASLAAGFQDYATALSSVSYPSSVDVQASAAESAASAGGSAVNSLASSATIQAYAATAGSQEFQSSLNEVDSTYRALDSALGG